MTHIFIKNVKEDFRGKTQQSRVDLQDREEITGMTYNPAEQ